MQSFEMQLGGRTFTVETGKMAKQANGAVLIQYGETTVLSTVQPETVTGVFFQ